MPVSKEKKEALELKMNKLKIYEDDLIEKFILGSGSGGQKVNKTSSCVYLKHLPTGIEVKCQQDRSREMNRFLARRDLCEKIAHRIHQEKTKRQQQIEKIRQQKKRRSRRLKKKILEDKKKHSETKALRRKVKEE
ncbi:MAG: peptide chain release factor-like protein [Simkaniaceae bacterium]|nr:MAG: peptide chain release factor-like protein [Simkaniaceae bacterium]